jgi:hypothetical protein
MIMIIRKNIGLAFEFHQGAMCRPLILSTPLYKLCRALYVQQWYSLFQERWQKLSSGDFNMENRRQGTISIVLQLQQELDDIHNLVITLQSTMSTLASLVLSVLELNVNQRKLVQDLNDEVDALRNQLEEILLHPVFEEPQENATADTKSTNSSPGVSHLPSLKVTVQQAEDDEMDEVNDHTRSPP